MTRYLKVVSVLAAAMAILLISLLYGEATCGKSGNSRCFAVANNLRVGQSRADVIAIMQHAFLDVSADSKHIVFICAAEVRGICNCIPRKALVVDVAFDSGGVKSVRLRDELVWLDRSERTRMTSGAVR